MSEYCQGLFNDYCKYCGYNIKNISRDIISYNYIIRTPILRDNICVTFEDKDKDNER
jgi:hypothetical protein